MLNDSKHTFAIYTPERTKQRWPIRLAAATELEMHDWVRKDSASNLNQLISVLSKRSVGDLFLS